MRSWGGLGPQSNEVGAWLKQSLIAHLDEPLHELPDAPFVGGDPSFIFFPRLPRPLHDRWLRVESTPLRPRGGIGRRNGLKIHRPYGHTGSTPVEAIDLILQVFCGHFDSGEEGEIFRVKKFGATLVQLI